MSRHANISIFVPHLGCPNRCSFCDQNHITKTNKTPSAADVDSAFSVAKASGFDSKTTEIAFFGGSFTAINRELMTELLSSAYKYVKAKEVYGIRISTRPDAISPEMLDFLKGFGVTSIELGAQSMSDDVLKKNRRGHAADDIVSAAKMIKANGFSLGLQMMTGLYGDSDKTAISTLEKLIELSPDSLRIYPTIVFSETELEKLSLNSKYQPQTIEQAIDLCAKLLIICREKKINVIRLGLHDIDEAAYVAGPWHPAFRELCESRIYLDLFLEKISSFSAGKYIIYVNQKEVSKATGQKKNNLIALKSAGFDCKILVKDELDKFEFEIDFSV